MTDKFTDTNDKNINKELNNICDECKVEDESVFVSTSSYRDGEEEGGIVFL